MNSKAWETINHFIHPYIHATNTTANWITSHFYKQKEYKTHLLQKQKIYTQKTNQYSTNFCYPHLELFTILNSEPEGWTPSMTNTGRSADSPFHDSFRHSQLTKQPSANLSPLPRTTQHFYFPTLLRHSTFSSPCTCFRNAPVLT